jgi:hypothetical protein
MTSKKENEEKTLRLIDKAQLTEDEPKTFSEDEEIFSDPKNLHDRRAFEVQDQISTEDPEHSDELDVPDERFSKVHDISEVTKDSILSKSAKLDKPSDED